MGETAIFRKEDSVAIPVAIALHVGVVALLLLQPAVRKAAPGPQSMTVSLASEVGLEATAPEIVTESSAAIAPVLGEEIGTSAEAETAPSPSTEIPTPPAATTRPSPATPPRTRSNTRSAPDRPRSRPDRTRSTPAPAPSPAQATTRGGGSRIGDDFLPGAGSSTTTQETRAPAATFGRRERASLVAAISRQLRRHWTAPNGVDAELLVSTVSWELNSDGSLRGTPTCRTDPSSINASNQPQAGLHCDRAIRAVRRAAPFNLPEQFYDRWDQLEFDFDRRL